MREIDCEVADYLNYCKNVRQMSAATLSAKQNVLKRFLECTQLASLAQLDNKIYNKWIAHETARGISPCSVNAYNAVILAMVRYYRGTGVMIPLNLALTAKLKENHSSRGFYSTEEITKVVELATPEIALMIKIMFETGMRIAELKNLKISDFNGRRVRFIGKGRKTREAYITPETLRDLGEYVKFYEIDNYLWAVRNGAKTLNGEPPTTCTIREGLKDTFATAGFAGFYPHALRHSFATNLQMKGASVEEIKEMIGHESIATTEQYLHGFEGRLEELFDKYQKIEAVQKA